MDFTTLRRRGVLLSLTLSFSVGTVASTIYVPSVPAIAHALDTTVARVQFTFVAYLLAYAISMLVLGPLSDRLGRRRTVLYGLALSAVSSLACAASPSIDFLIAARVLQGIGACAGMVVGRAITRDIWGPRGCRPGHRRARDRRHPDAGRRSGVWRICPAMAWLARQFRRRRSPCLHRYRPDDPLRPRSPPGIGQHAPAASECWRAIAP